jgi:tetratricopeptide (TPR) repeat protein
MDSYAFFSLTATVVAVIIIGVIPVSLGILWLRGHNPASLYDSFEKWPLLAKIPTVTVIVLVFLYAGILIISAIFTQYQGHTDQLARSKLQQYYNLLGHAQTSIDIEAYSHALDTINQAIAFMPDESRAYEMKAEVQYDQSNLDDAIISIIKGISLDKDPSSMYPYEWQAYILDGLERYDEAADSLEKAVTYNPSNYNLYGLLADNQNLSGQYDQALVSINVYIAHKKDDPQAYIDRGISYYWLKQCQEAMSNFSHAFDMLPKGEYLSDYVSSTTLQLYDVVMQDSDKHMAPGSCIDMVE